MNKRHLSQPSFYVKCLQVLVIVGTTKPFSGEIAHFHICHTTPLRPAFRFVTSIVLGVAYGRRVKDLNDEMVSYNHKSTLGKYIETFLGQPDSNSIS